MGIAGTVCTIVINKNIISPGIAPAVIIVGLDNLSVSSSYHGSTPRSGYTDVDSGSTKVLAL